MADFETAMEKAKNVQTVDQCRALFVEIAERATEARTGEDTQQITKIATQSARTIAELGR